MKILLKLWTLPLAIILVIPALALQICGTNSLDDLVDFYL